MKVCTGIATFWANITSNQKNMPVSKVSTRVRDNLGKAHQVYQMCLVCLCRRQALLECSLPPRYQRFDHSKSNFAKDCTCCRPRRRKAPLISRISEGLPQTTSRTVEGVLPGLMFSRYSMVFCAHPSPT